MARAPRTGGMIPRRAAAGPTTLINFHNQGLARAENLGARAGFQIEFLHTKALKDLERSLVQGVAVIRSSSIEAAVSSTDEIKQRMRSYLDGHFTGSDMHANNHRRVSNASVQSVYYDDVSDKGQFTSLIYSKFGYRGPSGFVDFLLLHIEGGTVRPSSGQWLRIPADGRAGMAAQSGFFPLTNRDIFFAPSSDGKKLYQLRRKRGVARNSRRALELIATLMRNVKVDASLAGLEVIMAQRGALFERHFDTLFAERMNAGAQ